MSQPLMTRSTPRLDFQTRAVSLSSRAPASLDQEGRSVEVVTASENAVRVLDWETWEIIDEVLLMSGLRAIPEQVPLLDAHSRESTGNVLGSARGFQVEGGQLLARAYFSQAPEAEAAFTKVREGHLTDLSVGYRVLEAVRVEPNSTAMVEGRSFTGPVRVVTNWELRELSLCPIGADAAAKVRAANSKPKPKEALTMNPKIRKYLETRGLAVEASEEEAYRFLAKITGEDLERGLHREEEPAKEKETKEKETKAGGQEEGGEAAVAAERERAAEIVAMCRHFGLDRDQEMEMLRSQKDLGQVRKDILDIQMRKSPTSGGIGHRPPVSLERDERDKLRLAARDSLLLRSGLVVEQPAPGAQDLRGLTLRELARECLRLAGDSGRGNALEMVGRALTSSDLPVILGAVANKSLADAYALAGETWSLWAAKGELPDFKPATVARAGETADLEEIPEDDEYKYGSVSEEKEVAQLATYGKLFSISRQAIINDDMGALSDIPAKHGRAAARKIGDCVYAVLKANAAMGDGIALFHASHNNLLSAAAPGVDSLGLAIKAMKLQKDPSGKATLNIQPRFFLAPVSLEGKTEQFFRTTLIGGASNQPNLDNPYAGNYFSRVYEPRLDADSITAWYLAGPQGMTVKVFFLNGMATPYLETKQGWHVDGAEYKVRIDVAAKAMDWRALTKNPGA